MNGRKAVDLEPEKNEVVDVKRVSFVMSRVRMATKSELVREVGITWGNVFPVVVTAWFDTVCVKRF